MGDAQDDKNTEKTKPAAKPKKPLIRRNIKPKKPVEPKKTVEPVEDANDEDNTPLPPAKNYNMDFLGKLDDPNFNPFETKTAVKNQFDASEPGPTVDQASENKENIIQPTNEEQKEEPSTNAEAVEEKKVEKVKKPLPKKPWLNKMKKKPPPPVESEPAPPAESEPAIESDDVIPVPSKGYNLDFLDQLDDPNFNPFETKTAVVNNFDENQPITEASELSQENENIVKVINVENNSEEKTDTSKEEKKEEKTEEKTEDKKEKTKPKKAQPPKPWLKKGPKKKA